MSAAIATKRQEIKDCEEQCQDSSTSGAETKGNNLQYDYLQTLRALWDVKALCLELLTMMHALYGCLPDHLESDADVVAAFLATKPKYYCNWMAFLSLVPFEIHLQFPDLMLRILKECLDYDEVVDMVAPDLWHNREVALALLRCCVVLLARRLSGPVQ